MKYIQMCEHCGIALADCEYHRPQAEPWGETNATVHWYRDGSGELRAEVRFFRRVEVLVFRQGGGQ